MLPVKHKRLLKHFLEIRSHMQSISELQLFINQELTQINFIKEPEKLYAPIQYVIEIGGKRIRPALTLFSCQMFSHESRASLNAAFAIEIFHNFTLLHDDIMDNAPLRRNMQTVHEKWDSNIAILSGDAMMIKAYQFLAKTESSILPQVLDIFNQTALEVCEGQQLDMDFEENQDVSEAHYIKMITLKTAVLMAAAMKIGALIGGATAQQAKHLYNFGINLGISFQLQDDLLDVYGNPDQFGKRVGGDIVSNKKTFLLISALHKSKNATRKELEDILLDSEIDPETKVSRVVAIYDSLNIKDLSEKKMDEYYLKAMQNLDKLDVKDEYKQELAAFASKLMKRVH